MTFTTWLATQTHRDDPVGDLARDVTQAIAGDGLQLHTAGDVELRIMQSGAFAAARDAFAAAYREWTDLLARAEGACRRHGIPVRYASNLIPVLRHATEGSQP